jgi:hypothetical protein
MHAYTRKPRNAIRALAQNGVPHAKMQRHRHVCIRKGTQPSVPVGAACGTGCGEERSCVQCPETPGPRPAHGPAARLHHWHCALCGGPYPDQHTHMRAWWARSMKHPRSERHALRSFIDHALLQSASGVYARKWWAGIPCRIAAVPSAMWTMPCEPRCQCI